MDAKGPPMRRVMDGAPGNPTPVSPVGKLIGPPIQLEDGPGKATESTEEAFERVKLMASGDPMQRYRLYRGAMHEHQNGEYVLAAEVERLRAERDRLMEYAMGQPCECYNEYGQRARVPCERCRLVYGHEDWAGFERAASAAEDTE